MFDTHGEFDMSDSMEDMSAQFDSLIQTQNAYDHETPPIQTTDFTCAVVSQQMILRQFGIDVSEAELVYEATSGGFLSRNGTSFEDVGRLLELHGVAVHQGYGFELLVDDLAHGRKVIVGVDSGELWDTDSIFEDLITPDGADHAVVVTGLDLSDTSDPKVVIDDPGAANGVGRTVPLDKFINAWRDSGEFFVATDEAAPDLESHPVIGTAFSESTGQYMDDSYWSQLKASLVNNLVANTEHVGQRFMDRGNINEAFVGIIVKTATDTFHDLSDADRDQLFRSI